MYISVHRVETGLGQSTYSPDYVDHWVKLRFVIQQPQKY